MSSTSLFCILTTFDWRLFCQSAAFFMLQWLEVRDGCLSCGYWRNFLPSASLFNLSFHNSHVTIDWFTPSKATSWKTYNTLVSKHFHSRFLFSSARPRDFDGMLGNGLQVSMYATKTPIDMWRFNIPQLKEFLTFSVKDRCQLNYFICIKDFNA